MDDITLLSLILIVTFCAVI